MTKQQKLILILFGIVDIIVIALMGRVVIKSIHGNQTISQQAQIPPCAQEILSALPHSMQPAVIWTDTELRLSLHVMYQSAEPPAESAQYLWEALDSLALTLTKGCPAPPTVTITVTAQGDRETCHHVIQTTGDSMMAWVQGTLSEADFISQARYRKLTASE